MLAALIAVCLGCAQGFAADEAVFRREVAPVLTKLGCNSGACHGSFQGRGGFRLSLLGFDPAFDYAAIVTEARGRRIFPASPEKSLLLTKPTMQLPHGGKKKLDVASENYRILLRWLAGGMTGGKEGPVVTELKVTPASLVLKKGEEAQLKLEAIWSDGARQDATRWALFESTHDTIASIDSGGKIRSNGPGRAAITVRYLGQVAAIPVTTPFGPESVFEFVGDQIIDRLLAREWKQLGIKPGELSSDSEFFRRVNLDLIGVLPTSDDVRKFLADRDPKKRAKLIDALLERPEYVEFWSLKWADLLRAHRRALGDKGLASFNGWLRQSIRENKPFDRIARELLTAQGNLFTNGPVAYYYIDKEPADLAETTAQIFMGVRLQCAKCHHHPFEVWSQDDYYGMAAFFARVQRKDSGENGAFGGAQSIRIAATGALTNPVSGKPMAPQAFSQKPLPLDDARDPRVALADWLTKKDNPFFARNIVNRYWGYLFGRGLVDPIDDLRATNPSAHPELFDALVKDFTDHNYDVKHLIRTICNSRVYQLACELNPSRDPDGVFFTHRQPRRLQAEVLLDAINQATLTSENFDKLPVGTRAIALPDPTVVSAFLEIFGRPKRTSTCECERGSRPDLGQTLHLANSEALHKKVIAEQGRVAKLIAAKKPLAAMIEELYLATLSRMPTETEKSSVIKKIDEAPSPREGLEDLLWALLNSAEFGFQH